jgi:hypothetical protein
MGSSGRYRCRPLPLFSVSYRFLPYCHGRGRGFEPRRPRHHSKALRMMGDPQKAEVSGSIKVQ